jgi:hypothetical protein
MEVAETSVSQEESESLGNHHPSSRLIDVDARRNELECETELKSVADD